MSQEKVERAPRRSRNAESNPSSNQGGARLRSGALLIFFGSLLGSLIGTFASVNDILDSIQRVGELINPPEPPITLCVAGSGTILGDGLGMAAQLGEDFEAFINNDSDPDTPEVDVQINPTGSLDGVQLAADGGCVHVLAMSEAMPRDQERLLIDNVPPNDGATSPYHIQCAAEIGYDVIAFVTDTNNDLPALIDFLMGRVLRGVTNDWGDVGARESQTIYIYAREGSGTTDLVLKNFQWPLGAQQFPPDANYIACDSNTDCLNRTLATPGSLYWVGTAWMRTQPTDFLRVLPILSDDDSRPIDPLRDEFDLREYPRELIRPLYMYVLGGGGIDAETQAMSRQFLEYVRGVAGQKVVQEFAFYTHFNRPDRVRLEFPQSFTLAETIGIRQICST